MVLSIPLINVWDAYQITKMSVLYEGFLAMDLVKVGEDYGKFVKQF